MTAAGDPTVAAVTVASLRGVQAFRIAACGWLAAVTALSAASVERPAAAVAGVVAALVVTVWWWQVLRPDAEGAVPAPGVPAGGFAPLVGAELAVSAALVAADTWVFDAGRAQSFGSVWPLAGVLAAAVLAGARAGVGAGAALGLARAVGEVGVGDGAWSATRVLAIASTGVLYALAGWAAAWAFERLRHAERRAALAVARDEVAAELHDGVLQTLAVIQRRSDDETLVDLARRQEADLRTYLAGSTAPSLGPVGVEVLLREVAADALGRFSLRSELALVPPLPVLRADRADLLRAALAELLANVAKHAGATRAVLFAESDGTVMEVGVSDDGVGFDPDRVDRRGLQSSVAARVEALGATWTLRAAPGSGTTVTVAVPLEDR